MVKTINLKPPKYLQQRLCQSQLCVSLRDVTQWKFFYLLTDTHTKALYSQLTKGLNFLVSLAHRQVSGGFKCGLWLHGFNELV